MALRRRSLAWCSAPRHNPAIDTPTKSPAIRPINDLADAVTMPSQALSVVGVCGVDKALTSPDRWWVAMGTGISPVVF